MAKRVTRRAFFVGSGAMAAGAFLGGARPLYGAQPASEFGYVIGQPDAERVGARVLADGGTAVDAIVAGALAAAVAAPAMTGIGGYGMTAIFALQGGKRIVCVDGNSTAPSAMRPDTFKLDANGQVPGRVNLHGWLSAGVPGLLGGMQFAIDRLGTWKFERLVQPAIVLARNGIPWTPALAKSNENLAVHFRADAGSRKLYLPDGKPHPAGSTFRNPALAGMLQTLAERGSVETFYRGDIGRRIADAFAKNGGLVTAADMAAYRARLVEPLQFAWDDRAIHTVPLTAGGLSVLQMLHALKAMNWTAMPDGPARLHARIEAVRLAWRDRLTLLGDPQFAKVPVDRLLSEDYARESAAKVLAAVKSGKRLAHDVQANGQTGTISLSAVDRQGNLAALTLTHGGAFGSCVTVDDFGLTLGHGVSRFDPHPDHPNAPGPGKRPLHNMVPSIAVRAGKPLMAIGGRGGRKIPNALLEVLTQYVVLGRSLQESIKAPRMHTEGDAALTFEKAWPAADIKAIRQLGYKVSTGASAVLSAAEFDGGKMSVAMR